MASILDRYGIKEVFDATFYAIGNDGKPTHPVLFLDSLKVSTIEQTGDESEARGGKGNPLLLVWDQNKEITVTIEDALFSPKSLAIMFGNGSVAKIANSQEQNLTDSALIMKTEVFTATDTVLPSVATSIATGKIVSGWNQVFHDNNGKRFIKYNPKFYDEKGNVVTTLVKGSKYFCSFDLKVAGTVIEVSPSTFPGTYYVVGDTYARSAISGMDEAFQIIIPKAKVQSENTITLEADGDPSTFNMSLRVMKAEDGSMMKLVQYDFVGGEEANAEADTIEIIHNHALEGENKTAAAG